MSGETPPAVINVGTMDEDFKYNQILICPVCSYEHYDHPKDEYTGAAEPRHRCSHNAYMLFAKGDCPVCQEDQTGPPTVGLSCGHVICPTDFERLGGRIGTIESKGHDEHQNRNNIATAVDVSATSDTTNRNGQRASETRRQRESFPWPVMSGDSGIRPGSTMGWLRGSNSSGRMHTASSMPVSIIPGMMMSERDFSRFPIFGNNYEESDSDDEDDLESSGSLPELIVTSRMVPNTGSSSPFSHSSRTTRNFIRTRQTNRRERRRNPRHARPATNSSDVTATGTLQPTGRMPTMRPSPAVPTSATNNIEILPLEVRGGGGGRGSHDRIDSDSDSMPELAGGRRGDAHDNSSSDGGSVPQLLVGQDSDSSIGTEDDGNGERDDSSSSSSSAPPPLSARNRRNGTNGANETNALNASSTPNSSNEVAEDGDGDDDGGDDSDESDDESDVPSLISRPNSNENSSSESDSDDEDPVRRPSRGNDSSDDDDSTVSSLSEVAVDTGDGVPPLVPRTSDIPPDNDAEGSASDGEAGMRASIRLGGRLNDDMERQGRQEREAKRKSDAATILSSLYRRYIAQKQYRRSRQSTLKIQTWGRRLIVQRKWSALLKERVAASRRFAEIWTPVLESVRSAATAVHKEMTWEAIKAERFDMLRTLIDQLPTAETTAATDRLDSAVQTALELSDRDLDNDGGGNHNEAEAGEDAAADTTTEVADMVEDASSQTLQVAARPKCDHIQLTKDVLRWLDRQDARYRGFFVRRILQLANGDRSRILRKNLTGAHNTTIWETYLEQKSGQRILWTEYKYSDDEGQKENEFAVAATKNKQYSNNNEHRRGLLIWYVAKHDNVSRLIKLIDDAERRSRRKGTTSADTLFADGDGGQSPAVIGSDGDVMAMDDNPHKILADPLGDTPLKVHLLHRDDLKKIEEIPSWKPPLHLTSEERFCVEKDGTVLLLGRSGTGKTICICNRMDYDRRLWSANSGTHDGNTLSQLFVARSHRICNYVRGIVDGPTNVPKETTYTTFSKLIRKCESTLLKSGEVFDSSRYVGFGRFKRDIYDMDCGLDTLVAWSQIRSFIKGSIEALMKGCPLTEEDYMALGVNRCRLSPESRKAAYAAYERYKRYLDQEKLWDDSDRASLIYQKFRSSGYETRKALVFDKVYVDEIQDYTQVELALFFLFSRQGGLFLAGDTAQSVVPGVEFRFEDLRSVGHFLFEGDPRYIPDKPVTVNTNFRSHAGILGTAAAILERMFEVFPRSANKLEPDVGVFLGPRPGIFQNLSLESLTELVSRIDGVVLLTHDQHVDQLQRIVGNTVIVLGVRESKGLEFPTVIIVDFFKLLSDEHQKPWRELLTIREQRGNSRAEIKLAVPEVETQLKLLYTAITRCSKRLFFAETGPSVAGSAFAKWATFVKKGQNGNLPAGKGLAVKQIVDDVEKVVKTLDEWRSSGVDFAMEAELASDDAGAARKWLIRAIHDFEKGNDAELKKKAEVNLSSALLRQELEEQYKELRSSAISNGGNDIIPPELIDEVERKASNIFGELVDEGLVKEARTLCDVFVPLLSDYSKNRLKEKDGVLSYLPTDDDYDG